MRQAEHSHNIVAVECRTKGALGVQGVDFGKFALDNIEVVKEALFFLDILGCDVGTCQYHQRVQVVFGVVDESTYGAVRHFVFHQRNGTHVQVHEAFDAAHFGSHRQFEPRKYARHHLGTYEIVVVECPSHLRVVALGQRLGDVVQQRRPSHPEVVGGGGYVVQHFECVVEVVFVSAPVDHLYAHQSFQFG